jgi:hypothetical protein
MSDVPNLYTYDEGARVFYFNYAEKFMNVKCETPIYPGANKIRPLWVDEPVVELGVNYAGKIHIEHEGVS